MFCYNCRVTRGTDKPMNQKNNVSAPKLSSNDPAQRQPIQNPQSEPHPESDIRPKETGGQKGPEPTRYGDWEKNGRCTDF